MDNLQQAPPDRSTNCHPSLGADKRDTLNSPFILHRHMIITLNLQQGNKSFHSTALWQYLHSTKSPPTIIIPTHWPHYLFLQVCNKLSLNASTSHFHFPLACPFAVITARMSKQFRYNSLASLIVQPVHLQKPWSYHQRSYYQSIESSH